jgi:agmatinase
VAQASALDYLRDGQTPFFRLGRADPALLPAGTRAALVGVPTDAGTTYQPGTRLAPFHVRRVSALLQGWHAKRGLEVFERTGAVDAGNVVFPPFDRGAARDAIEATVLGILAQGAAPLLVGGDHSITLPALRAAARRHGPLGVLHLDAHLDTSGPEGWGDAWHHGTPIGNAIAEGLVAPGKLWQVGLRGPWSTPQDGAPGDRIGARRVDVDAFAQIGVAPLAQAIGAALAGSPVWITVDVDAVDPAFAPGTGTPVPGGPTAREVLALLRYLRGLRIAGMDVVEVCPALDHADLTSHLAAHLLYEGLALLAAGIDLPA